MRDAPQAALIAKAVQLLIKNTGAGTQRVATIFSGVHRSRQRKLGPGGKRAKFSLPTDAQRAMRRVDRWTRSPRTHGDPPAHIAELRALFQDVPR